MREGEKPTKKPSRGQLIRTIGELQDLIGKARGAYMNDRDPNRWDSVVRPLNRAFDICVQATQFDPPPRSRP